MGFIMVWTPVDKGLPVPFPIFLNPSQKPFTKLNPINEINSRLYWKSNGSLMIFSLSELVSLRLLIRSWRSDIWVILSSGQIDSFKATKHVFTHEWSDNWIRPMWNRQGFMTPVDFLVVLYHTFGFWCVRTCLYMSVCHVASCCKAALCFHVHNSSGI